jgi:hypothetical protein
VELSSLRQHFQSVGCNRLYAKILAPNDNSKNQVYLGPNFDALQLLPNKGVRPDTRTGKQNYKAALDFGWLTAAGNVAPAPWTTLILYPKYPEVRLSGFLRGCEAAPKDLMTSRDPGRVLLMGVTSEGKIVAAAFSRATGVAREIQSMAEVTDNPVLLEIGLEATDTRLRLLTELCRIHRKGWIASKQLDATGNLGPCESPNCGGLTLEAELGIPKNSKSEPDYLGWEIKQHAASSLDRMDNSARITLMTPEPDGGFYADCGVEDFVRRFGYADMTGRPDRFNFGGVHRAGQTCQRTGLALRLTGLGADGKIMDVNGAVEIVAESGEVAASWSFGKFLEHWSKKHARAVYIPSLSDKSDGLKFRYGNIVRLAVGTNPLLLLRAISEGAVCYDPGIKLENASSKKPTTKKRSQFRVGISQIAMLYSSVTTVDACSAS